jgi:hypothetical protein
MHEFGWTDRDYDLLSAGSLAGHVIECGAQATGGLHTDWRDVPDWAHIGYPVITCHADGSFVVGKPPGTGGLVNTAVIAEQMLYEIHDPARYLLPDVACDFTEVRLTQRAPDEVHVAGARGLPPSGSYKVSATWPDGFRCSAQLTIVGFEAAAKAQRTGEAILQRCTELLTRAGLAPFSRSEIEVLGSESPNYGPHAMTQAVREVVLRVVVMHPVRAALELFAREIAPAGTSWSPGTTGADGRPSPSPCIRQFAFLLDKSRLAPVVVMDGQTHAVKMPATQPPSFPRTRGSTSPAPVDSRVRGNDGVDGDTIEVPLIRLAWGRSGDKGDTSNIGIIARRPEWLPLLREQLGTARVADWLAHRVKGPVTRYDVPGIHAMNFVCEQALGGGGMASLRNDPLGKGMAQILLAMPLRIPAHWLD